MPPASPSTALSITNPLILYRALLSTKRVDPDPAQHRLAIHLQKLYERLKDYEPVVQYGHRLQQISRQLGSTPARPAPTSQHDAPYAKAPSGGLFSAAFQRKEERKGLELTRVLTSQEAALELNSPRGLMLHGEVGTGKSMLIDLFADCLPNRKKKRWHYTTFMLHVLHKLETLRRSRQLIIPSSLGQEDDYSLLWLARDMISTSPILFLDEFQLPDRAAAKIMTNLMTCFFHLGGVLIATSNRMPEELAQAAGMDFAQPTQSSPGVLGWSLGLGRRKPQAPPGKRSEYAAFLDVLRARCEVWELEGGKDYRRREAEAEARKGPTESVEGDEAGFAGLQNVSEGIIGLGWEQSAATEKPQEAHMTSTVPMPKNYYVVPSILDPPEKHDRFKQNLARLVSEATSTDISEPVPWMASSMRVYGRDVPIPRQHAGTTLWTFAELCINAFGPADYITLASTYHTLILTDVPVLSSLQKNEARRLINLLDALYEARGKLIITAEAGPDDLFFPEQKSRSSISTSTGDTSAKETVDQDAVYSETLSEIYQDATAPFRPNISSYTPDPSASAPEEVDGTHARFAGMFAESTPHYSQGGISPADQLEDTPPNTAPRRGDAATRIDTGDDISVANGPGIRRASGPDFQKAGVFTGEDEKFAYKRARSRLWEMCGGRWWARGRPDIESEADVAGAADADNYSWWRPVAPDVRRWEGSITTSDSTPSFKTSIGSEMSGIASPMSSQSPIEGAGSARGIDQQADEVLFRHGASPFRTATEPPPRFSLQHFWGTVKWGKKAGKWGKGPEGLNKETDDGSQETRDDDVKRRYEWRKQGPDETTGRPS